ncbi:hypothetical protein FPQ18DRAFT_408419 [Pyronema domesticum]|nr:hypothetical protein FPQ18DRAFT_408419 [Pyronema domesticum]
MASLGDQTMETKKTAVSVDPAKNKQSAHLSEIQLMLLRNAEEGKRLSEMLANESKSVQDLQQQIDQLTEENDLLAKGYRELEEDNNQLVEEISQLKGQLAMDNEAREVAIEQLKAQPIMQDMINKLVEEKTELEEELSKLKEHHHNSTAEMQKQVQELEEQKAGWDKEVEFLRQKEIHLQKEVDKTGQDGFSKDMAMVLKRYYEMEEQFGQAKTSIKRVVKTVLAEKEKIFQQVQEHIVENEKRMQENLMDNEKKMQELVQKRLFETEDHLQRQVEGRLTENEKQIEQRLVANEVKIWGHAQEIQQKVKENIVEHDQKIMESLAKNDQQIKESIAQHDEQIKESIAKHNQKIKKSLVEHDQKIKEGIAELSGETVNKQGYFTRMIPMKEIPNDMTQITGAYGGGCLYVQRDKIATYDNFRNLIKSVWGLDLKLYSDYYRTNGVNGYSYEHWHTHYLKFQSITITPYHNNSDYHLMNCTC